MLRREGLHLGRDRNDPIEDEGTKILKIKPRVSHQVKEIQVRERDVPNVDLLLSLAAVQVGVAFDAGTRSVGSPERPSGY